MNTAQEADAMGTTEHPRRWGKAGVRLSPREATARDRAGAARRRARDRRHTAMLATARVKWAEGLVVPHLITMALDGEGLWGPAVDHALGVEEPAVDLWEQGRLYPNFEQLCALAELTGKTPEWFTRRDLIDAWPPWTTLCFHTPEARGPDTPRVLRFSDAALLTAGIDP